MLGEISDFRTYSEFEAINKKRDGLYEDPIIKRLKRYITFDETGIETNKMLITNDVEDDDNESNDSILSYEKCAYTSVEDSPERNAMVETYTRSSEWGYGNGFLQ